MKNQIGTGDVVDVVAPSAVKSGDVLVSGSLLGICEHDADLGASVAVRVNGVLSVTKRTNQAWTLGQLVYYDAVDDVFTTASTSGNTKAGVAIEAAALNATTGKVRLSGTF